MTFGVLDMIPAAFPALALAHFVALLSPGPDFFLVVGHSVRRGVRGALFICVGIAVGNAVYIVLAGAGWSVFKDWPALYRGMEVLGAAYLLWLGVMLVRSGRRAGELAVHALAGLTPARQFMTGLGSAVLNPKNAVFYLTLMTVILGPQVTPAQQVFCGVWMALLVFVWDTALAAVIGHSGVQRFLQAKIPLVETVAGIALMSIAALFVAQSIRSLAG